MTKPITPLVGADAFLVNDKSQVCLISTLYPYETYPYKENEFCHLLFFGRFLGGEERGYPTNQKLLPVE